MLVYVNLVFIFIPFKSDLIHNYIIIIFRVLSISVPYKDSPASLLIIADFTDDFQTKQPGNSYFSTKQISTAGKS